MNQSLAMITLAVEDIARSLAFYRDGLGWTPAFDTDDIAFFQMNGFVFGLYRKTLLAEEIGGDVVMGGKSLTLAHNVASKDAVDAAIAEVRALDGGTIIGEPVDRVWGGYSGYFEDPDGHVWEVAWNPHWTISPEGHVSL